ncbi:Plant mobile domain protein family [Zea mays]|uniref:Plant mobile domain protein family n=1 Tax=Zea mays TaxID=4577 RepID=A0A1D6NQH0_MAIZE|nr:Plant mobile domain protein family [Zea mays]
MCQRPAWRTSSPRSTARLHRPRLPPSARRPRPRPPIYRDLREIKAFLIATGAAATTGNADMISSLSVYSPLYILQLWMWERFPALRPAKVNPLVDGDPLAARWHDLSRKLNPAQIREALSTGCNFVWQPYVSSMEHTGWVHSSDLAEDDELASLAQFLHPCELVGMDCIEQYLPHRVARQFGLDQDVPADVHRANQDWAIAWQTYQLEGKNVAFFIPHSEPGITTRYAQWWRQQLLPSGIDAATASAPVEWKTSKRKVKKTPAAMEAEAEKERKMKKARVSPTYTDKKRKLEELYDAKLSDWLPTARNEISDTTSDMESEEALLPNVGTTNDDIVLLMPRKQTTTAPVRALMDNDMILALGERGNFMVDEPPDIQSEPEAVVPATLDEEIVKIPEVISLDIPDKPEEGATAVMEEQKEATSVSDRSEEASALVIGEVEEKVAIEGAICVTGMNPSGNNSATVMEADERNAVPKEFGRAAKEVIEAVPQSQHEVNAGVINNSHDVVALPEEAHPVQPTNNSGGCPVVSCIMEDSKVAGDSGKIDYEYFCDFVEEQREIPCVQEISGENSRMGEKEREETSHESPQLEIVECVQDIVLRETDYDVNQKIVYPAVEDVATSDSMSTSLLGVPEPENAELNKHPYLAIKDEEDIPMEAARGEVAEMEQISTSAKGGAEEHGDFSELDHMGRADAKLHLHLNSEVPEKIDEIECKEVAGTMRLTGRYSDQKLGDVPEVGYTEDENIRGLVVNTSDRKPSEVSQVEPAKLEHSKDLVKEETDKSENIPGLECIGLEETRGDLMEECANTKSDNVPELENTGLGGTHGPIEDTDGRLKEIHDVNAELDKHNVHESDIDRSEDIMQIDPLTQDKATWLAKEETEDKTTKVQEVKYEQLRNEPPIQEDSKEKPCADSKDLSENVVVQSKEVDKLKQAGEGCQALMEKDMENASGAFVLEQTEDGHRKSLIETSINNDSEITLVEQLDGQSESLTRTGTVEIHGETIKAQDNEFYKDVVEDSNDSTNEKDVVEDSNESINAKMPCSSATVQLKEDKMEVFHEGKMEEPCAQDAELSNQREPSSDATAMEIEAVALEQDSRIICKNMEATTVEGSHTLDSGLSSDLAKVNETHAAREIKNQEVLDVDMKVAMSVCGEYQINSIGMEDVKSTKGSQNQECLDQKEDHIMEERVECEVREGSGVSYEEACELGGGRVKASGVAVDVSGPVLNKEACNTEELQAREDKKRHGVGHVNEKRVLEETSMIDTGELKSDSTVMEISMAGLRQGTLNQCASSSEKEEAVQEKHDQGLVDENTNRGSADNDALECGGVNPDVAITMFHETILTTEAVNIAGSKISSENQQKEAPFEVHSITEVEGSESNESSRKEPEGALALPQEPGNLVKVKQESLENETEMSIFRENDKVSGKDQASAEFIIDPSNTDERRENDIGRPDESAKGCERLTSDSINTVHSKFGKSSNEEDKRTQNTRSTDPKDIKESLGRIRAEPSNRVHTTSVGYYSQHAAHDPISSCKEIKVPLRDGARDSGRDRALELVVTSPREETPRWRQEQYALQILEDVQNSRIAERSRMEMEIRVLKAQVSSMERQVMNLDHFSEVKSRSSLNQQMVIPNLLPLY